MINLNLRYLKEFSSQNDYENNKAAVMAEPHVVLLTDTKSVVYKQAEGGNDEPEEDVVDYSLEYFTIEALEEGTVGIGIPNEFNFMAYSLNNNTWEIMNEAVQIPVQANDTVKIKCETNQFAGGCAGLLSVSCTFNVYGNVMSLLYGDEFNDKTSLEGYNDRFLSLFKDCTTLVSAENLILPATTLANSCYQGMFYGCRSLTTAPELPATYLAYGCYYNMFDGCTSLTTAPELPATTLANNCYQFMFYGCTSLTTAPELPATTLANGCYSHMFYGCSQLNQITMLATDISASFCLSHWVSGVASSGVITLNRNLSLNKIEKGVNGIPDGWGIKFPSPGTFIANATSEMITFYHDDGLLTIANTAILSNYTSLKPICNITVDLYDAENDKIVQGIKWLGNQTLEELRYQYELSLYNMTIIIIDVEIPEDNGYYYYYDVDESEPFVDKDWMRIVSLEDGNEISVHTNVQYSINGDDWRKLNGNTITVNADDIVYFKGTELRPHFSVSKPFNAEGNIMSLIYNNEFEVQNNLSGKDEAFYDLFNSQATLISAENLILPATTLADRCYFSMFLGCTSLTTAPELPATYLADYCYSDMFHGCTSLTTAPELPATYLAYGCYYNMFQGCTSLTTAPELPATTLADSCYYNMFNGCRSLTTAPELPANTLVERCYQGMFKGCTSLTTAPSLQATTLAYGCYSHMFYGCTSLTTAPSLPATTLAYGCYSHMFYGCSQLNQITMLATDISASFCLSHWVSSVASEGTFIKNTAMTSLPSGTSGIPSGWNVEDYQG